MKNFIKKTNKYLLEKHPIIWNTKLLWVLLTALVLHLIFYILGLTALSNVEILHQFDAKSIFFKNGTVYVSIILSILLLVVWLINMFKNNAFKSYYPTSKLKLFKQFLCYLLIVFFSTNFFLSYNFGLKNYITAVYDDDRLDAEIDLTNTAAIFFSNDLENYTLNQRRYPAPFDSLYCQIYTGSTIEEIQLANSSTIPNDSLPHSSFLDSKYYHYTLYSKKGKNSDAYNNNEYQGFVFYKNLNDSLKTYYFKDAIFDISNYVNTAKPSFFNYSSIFYKSKKSINNDSDISVNYNYRKYDYFSDQPEFSEENKLSNKRAYNILKRNNPNEIKEILDDFLTVCSTYKIKYNLTTDKWFNLIYHPKNFEVQSLIRIEPKTEYTFSFKGSDNPLESFKGNILTDYFIEHDSLGNLFSNVEEIKESTPYLESIHFFMWFSIFIATIVLMFRITGIKALLFSVIASGVLALVIGLSTAFFAYTSKFSDNSIGYFISYFSLVIGTIILLTPIFYKRKLKKIVVAICLNISLIGFIGYVFLIITTISLHQSDACKYNYSVDFSDKNCFNLLGSLGVYWSYILFFFNLIFLYFYFSVVKKWKALPEG